jgi:Flp pilus assembly protein TadD/GR25 family glycosyltransferase involved in LPS biosynthesis
LHIHFINLDRSKDRLAEFKATNAHLAEITRIPAIEEHRIDIHSLARQGLVDVGILRTYPVGALCQALSHYALWNKAVETGRAVTIADDDAIFNLNFDASAADVIKILPPDWDLIVWGWNFDAVMIFDMLSGVSPCIAQFDQDKMRLNTRAFQELTVSPHAHRLLWSFGHTSYTVSPRGGQNLKNRCFPLRPMLVPLPEGAARRLVRPSFPNIGLDVTLNSAYPHLKAYVCIPPLVISTNEHSKSTIQPGGVGIAPPGPPDAAALIARGAELQKADRLEEALAHYDQVLQVKDEIAALVGRGSVLVDLGRFDEALSTYDKILAVQPNDFNAHNMRGLVLENLKGPQEALASYEKAIALKPDTVEGYYNRGNVLADLSRFEEALASYDKALAIKSDALHILNNRGLVLEQLHRFEEALASYEKALKINPNYSAAGEHRRLLLLELKRALR